MFLKAAIAAIAFAISVSTAVISASIVLLSARMSASISALTEVAKLVIDWFIVVISPSTVVMLSSKPSILVVNVCTNWSSDNDSLSTSSKCSTSVAVSANVPVLEFQGPNSPEVLTCLTQ